MGIDFITLKDESQAIRKTIISVADYVDGKIHWGSSLA